LQERNLQTPSGSGYVVAARAFTTLERQTRSPLTCGMKTNRLALRSPPAVVLALAIGPIVGLTGMWFIDLVLPGTVGGDPNRGLAALILYVVLGGALCLATEAIVIAPLLIGFRRWRWPWLNGWSGAALGFGLGFTIWTLAQAASTPGSPRWPASYEAGLVGLISAIVFRVIAVRRAEDVSSDG
jgi:hypothetical protein